MTLLQNSGLGWVHGRQLPESALARNTAANLWAPISSQLPRNLSVLCTPWFSYLALKPSISSSWKDFTWPSPWGLWNLVPRIGLMIPAGIYAQSPREKSRASIGSTEKDSPLGGNHCKRHHAFLTPSISYSLHYAQAFSRYGDMWSMTKSPRASHTISKKPAWNAQSEEGWLDKPSVNKGS